MAQLKKIYCYDKDGYFTHESLAQVGEGIFLPSNATEVAPEMDGLYWYKFDTETNTWSAEKKPTSFEELLGITLDVSDMTSDRIIYLKGWFDNAAQDPGYVVERNDNILTIRETTLEEERARVSRKNDDAYSDTQGKIVIIDEMYVCNNADTRLTLQTAAALIAAGETFTFVDELGISYEINDAVAILSRLSKINTTNAEVWGKYKTQIDAATTKDELKAIEFTDYVTGEDNE